MPSEFLRSRGLQAEAALLSSGRLTEAKHALGLRPGAAAAVALAWTALAQDDPADALVHAGRACEEAREPTDLLMARVSRAVARAGLHHPIEQFDARDVLGVDALLLPEALHEIARACTAANDPAGAQRWLALAEPSGPYVATQRLLLRARLAGMELNFTMQAQLALDALQYLEPRAADEALLFREAARLWAASARETANADRAVFARIAQCSANDDRSRCEILRAHAWVLGLHGDYDRAISTLMQATLHVRAPLQHVALYGDLAAIAVTNGETHSPFAQAALDTAFSSCAAVRWEDAAPEDTLLIPQLLQTAAEMQRGQLARSCEELAKRILERHEAQPGGAVFSRYTALLHESRAFAYAHSDEGTALQHAREAHTAFEAFRYDWRAGRMALFIYQLTGLREWEQRAKTHLRTYRSSRMYRLLDAGGSQRLTRRQQQVLDAVLHGKSVVQIAMHLRISEETVRKHLGPVMRHFGVKTRIELLAKVRLHSTDHAATFQKSETMGSGANP